MCEKYFETTKKKLQNILHFEKSDNSYFILNLKQYSQDRHFILVI